MKIHSGRHAISLFSGAMYAGEVNVVCPNCLGHHTHVQHVGTLVGSDEAAAVAYDGTGPSGVTPSRSSAVEVVLRCERCPELFAIVLQQHKGINFLQIHQNVSPQPGS